MTALPGAVAAKAAPLLARLATDHDGEALACVRALRRLLDRHGLTMTDLAAVVANGAPAPSAPPPREPETEPADWVSDLATCAAHFGALSENQRDFITNMGRVHRRGGRPTPAQAQWLRALAERFHEEAEAAAHG